MPRPPSFFVYSPRPPEGKEQKAHVLFHDKEPGWLAVNDTGLEVAKRLDIGESIADAARYMATRYNISAEVAERDVRYVFEQLKLHRLLDSGAKYPNARSPSLDSAFLHLTSRCNLFCPHCYSASKYKNAEKDLPTSVVLRAVDELADNGARDVTFSGGEPLLHPDIREILGYTAPRLGIRLLTNGSFIDREWAAFLADMDIFIQLSIDGSGRKIHDTIRGKGHFDQSLKALEYLQEAGLGDRINFSTTIMEQNLLDLSCIISLAERLGVPHVRFLPLRRCGRAREEWDSVGVGISEADCERFFGEASHLQKKGKASVEISCGLSGFLLKMPEAASGDNIWCPVGRKLVIGVNGDVFPCVLMMRNEFRLGNALDDSLVDTMQSNGMKTVCRALADRRVRIEKCSKCNYRNLCQAGCMGQALDEKGTIWATDRFCDYRRKAYKDAFDKILGYGD